MSLSESINILTGLVGISMTALGVFVARWQGNISKRMAEIERLNSNMAIRSLRSNSFSQYIDLVHSIFSDLQRDILELNAMTARIQNNLYEILNDHCRPETQARSLGGDFINLCEGCIKSIESELDFQYAANINMRIASTNHWSTGQTLDAEKDSDYYPEWKYMCSDRAQKLLSQVFSDMKDESIVALNDAFKKEMKPVLTWMSAHENRLRDALQSIDRAFERNDLEEFRISENERLHHAMRKLYASTSYIATTPLRYLSDYPGYGAKGEVLRLGINLHLVLFSTLKFLSVSSNRSLKGDSVSHASLLIRV